LIDPAMSDRKTRILVIDDSMVNRKWISEVLRADARLEVAGTATDPFSAREKILDLEPDVVVLDLDTPKMDGVTFLRLLMKERPLPVVAMALPGKTGSRRAVEALEAGAVDVIFKTPSDHFPGESASELLAKVTAAATRKISPLAVPKKITLPPLIPSSPAPGGNPVERIPGGVIRYHPMQAILLGASTGGTEALRDVLMRLPGDLPGICIVQHIPEGFSSAFAERLNAVSTLEVREAKDGDSVRPGLALIAPGDLHMTIQKDGSQGYRVKISDGPKVAHHRPSVDLLFQSAAAIMGPRAVAGLFTGMGRDGAEGLLALRQAGAKTFAQDEESCVVFGMPRAAMENGAAEKMVPLSNIAAHIVKLAGITSTVKSG
jgi:two-component system chemotaxis response regulator CheB